MAWGIAIVCLCHSTCSLTFGAEPAWEPLGREDEISALELISARIQENHTRFHTWSGSYTVEEVMLVKGATAENLATKLGRDVVVEGAKFLKIERGRCEFAVDVRTDALYSSLKVDGPPKMINVYTGYEAEIDLTPTHQRSILTPEHFLSFNPDRMHGPLKEFPAYSHGDAAKSGRTAFRTRAVEGKAALNTVVVDPRTFLFEYPSKDSAGRFAKMLKSGDQQDIERSQATEFQVFHAEVDGATLFKVSYHSPTPDKTDILVERIYSEAAGYNPLEERLSQLPDRALRQRFEWDYVNTDDIYVPKMHRRQFASLEGPDRFDRTYRLVEAKVNQPIDPSTFTPAQLGLEEGDRLVDQIEQKFSIYHGEALVAPDDGRGSPFDRLLSIMAWSSPAVLVVSAILVSRQRRRLVAVK